MNHVGINISENKLQIVEVVKKSSGYFLENVEEESFRTKLDFLNISSDFVDNIQNALDQIKKKQPFNSRKASIALPVNSFRVFNFPYIKELSQSELKEHIEWEFSILFPTLSFENYMIRPKKISESFYSHQEIVVFAIEKNLIQTLHELLIKNDMSLQFVDNAHFASDLLLKKQALISIYIASDSSSCSLYSNGSLVGFRKFIPTQTDTLADYLSDVTSIPNHNFSTLNILGDTNLSDIKKEIEDSLRVGLETIDPFSRIKQSESFNQNEVFLKNPELFSSAAGISFRVS